MMGRQAVNRNRNRNRNSFLLRLIKRVVSNRCALLLKTLLNSVTTNQYPFRSKLMRLNMQPAKACPILGVPIAKNRILMPDL